MVLVVQVEVVDPKSGNRQEIRRDLDLILEPAGDHERRRLGIGVRLALAERDGCSGRGGRRDGHIDRCQAVVEEACSRLQEQ